MSSIQVLDPHVADLIAAGEVVERPASVAKELMENAIDAGAKAVTVEIAHGGMTFLRVTDDGCGIPPEELKTAFLRHATSKLRTEYDLEAIGTLGFRGEALAAIAAVSRVEVMTRTPDRELGASLEGEGGVFGQVEEAGCPLGTTMVVRDLFYNTPARLKFMKRDATEGAAVFAVVQRVALSHPEVRVQFLRDGKQELLTPGDGQLRPAVYAVLGRELALGLTEVNSSGEGMSVRGFVSKPVCCRASRNGQFFFVNGRQVKSALMTAALERAYQNQKMVGKFPACVLHLDIRKNAVDVNVHPAKTEVKFDSEQAVFHAVYHAVLSALEGDRSRPTAVLEREDRPAAAAPAAERPPLAVADPTARAPSRRPVLRSDPLLRPGALTPSRPPAVKTTEPGALGGAKRPDFAPVEPKPAQPVENHVQPVENFVEKVETPRPPETPPQAAPQADAPPVPDPAPLLAEPETPPWRVVGEAMNTYILVEQGDSLLLIDKHAAHERMNFDRMKAEGYVPMVQALLTPLACRLAPEEQAVLLDNLPLLEQFGFQLEEFGGDTVIVRAVPSDLDVGEVEGTLTELAQTLLAAGSADPAAARDGLLHTMACKAAIKGGWRSSPQELERVAQAVLSGEVKYCPHGRPVALTLTRRQLEKQFKRS